jgi:2-haloacid dehalogenase
MTWAFVRGSKTLLPVSARPGANAGEPVKVCCEFCALTKTGHSLPTGPFAVDGQLIVDQLIIASIESLTKYSNASLTHPAMDMDIPDLTHLTFDCYGTLIDWETGLLQALDPWITSAGKDLPPIAILQSFVTHEARVEAQPWQPYREVLARVLESMAQDLQFTVAASQRYAIADSLPSWKPFADTVPALRRLKRRFQLVIVSNIDDALFAGTARLLDIPFDEVVTAEQVRSYKPAVAHFQEALRRLKVPVDQVLHVAQSLYHDHVPARRLGFRTAWVQRPSRLPVTGLAPKAEAQPDWIVSDVAELADGLKC